MFSSTASVYGEPDAVPVRNRSPAAHQPLWRKQARHGTHDALGGRGSGIRSVILRYFNIADWAQGEIGEDHRPESHLIPISSGSAGQKARVSQFSATTTQRPTAHAYATILMWWSWPTPTCAPLITCGLAAQAKCATLATARVFLCGRW